MGLLHTPVHRGSSGLSLGNGFIDFVVSGTISSGIGTALATNAGPTLPPPGSVWGDCLFPKTKQHPPRISQHTHQNVADMEMWGYSNGPFQSLTCPPSEVAYTLDRFPSCTVWTFTGTAHPRGYGVCCSGEQWRNRRAVNALSIVQPFPLAL